jgi:thiol-disulfide isomerase/thioredoxin
MRQFMFAVFIAWAGLFEVPTPSFAEPPAAAVESPAAAATEKPKPREPIYDEAADGKQLVAAGLERARLEGKHVLVVFGGNWCGWCYLLHDLFDQNDDIRQLLLAEYEVVLVDVNTNEALRDSYGDANKNHGVPFLTVLDPSGAVLVNQNTGDLEDGPKHDVAKVKDFLTKWIPERRDAESVLKQALADAEREHKRVFVQFGAPGCGWCRVLTKYLHDQHELFADDFVIAKIDTERMTAGQDVSDRFRKTETGIPWIVILDEHGDPLVDSESPKGNIGYPVKPHEIAHFIQMLKTSAPDLSSERLTEIERTLQENSAKYDRPPTPAPASVEAAPVK